MNTNNYLWDTPSDVALRLAKKLRRIRKRKHITQKQLASRSNSICSEFKKRTKSWLKMPEQYAVDRLYKSEYNPKLKSKNEIKIK